MPRSLLTLDSLQATTRQGDSGEAGGALDRAHFEVLQTKEGEMSLYIRLSQGQMPNTCHAAGDRLQVFHN